MILPYTSHELKQRASRRALLLRRTGLLTYVFGLTDLCIGAAEKLGIGNVALLAVCCVYGTLLFCIYGGTKR